MIGYIILGIIFAPFIAGRIRDTYNRLRGRKVDPLITIEIRKDFKK